MPTLKISFATLAMGVLLAVPSTVSADTWHLVNGKVWKEVSGDPNSRLQAAIAEAKMYVNTGQTDAARDAFAAIKNDFPNIVGDDFDAFVKAELYYSKDQYVKAVRSYDKLLTAYPKSTLRQAALEREFAIATAYLGGRKKVVLWVIRLSGYAEGVQIMDKITDRAGIRSPLGVKAALAVAKSYEERKLYDDAYLKWWEISLEWQTGQTGRDALLGMARCKLASYDKESPSKRPHYDASRLRTAKSCYERFKLLYPAQAKEIDVDQKLKEIDEQLARKQLSIGRFYQRVGFQQSADLYYGMVITDWPATEAARTARALVAPDPNTISHNQAPREK
jgi:outer membrane protein assembly factor BamD (BamD/ComL family)